LPKGLNCDLITGEQPYKMRLANSVTPLFKLCLPADALAELAGRAVSRLVQGPQAEDLLSVDLAP